MVNEQFPKNRIEFKPAEPLPDSQRWNLEDVSDKVTTPDGRVYRLAHNEKVILSSPKEGEAPEAFIVVSGLEKIPFEEWAKTKQPE